MTLLRTLAFVLCSATAVLPADGDDLEVLRDWMTGSFSSEAQAAETEGYFDIRLEMAPIWTDREGEIWLYVEQAAASSLDRPYRQRVYALSRNEDGSFRSEVYELPEPLSFAGAWRDASRFEGIGPDDLEIRAGCAVILRRVSDERFAGSTEGESCLSTLRGASYATSEVVVTSDGIESWDRGFSEAGEHVWGAEDGPYLFLRTSE